MLFDCPITKDDVINCINSLALPKTSSCENYYSRKEKQFVSESIRGSMARLFRETFQFFDCASGFHNGITFEVPAVRVHGTVRPFPDWQIEIDFR